MWQEIILALIGIFVIAYVGRKIYALLAHPSSSTCGGCTDCPLRINAKPASRKRLIKQPDFGEAHLFHKNIGTIREKAGVYL